MRSSWLTKHGADSQATNWLGGTAAEISEAHGAPRPDRVHGGGDALRQARVQWRGAKKCAGCLVIFYCGKECEVAHWPADKAPSASGARDWRQARRSEIDAADGIA